MDINWINKSAGVYILAIKFLNATFTGYLDLFLYLHVYAILIRINHNVMVVLHCIKTYILQNHLLISEAHTGIRDDFEISCLKQKMWFYYTMIEDRIKIFGVCILHQTAKEKISNLFVIFKFDCKRKWLRRFQPSLGLW